MAEGTCGSPVVGGATTGAFVDILVVLIARTALEADADQAPIGACNAAVGGAMAPSGAGVVPQGSPVAFGDFVIPPAETHCTNNGRCSVCAGSKRIFAVNGPFGSLRTCVP